MRNKECLRFNAVNSFSYLILTNALVHTKLIIILRLGNYPYEAMVSH